MAIMSKNKAQLLDAAGAPIDPAGLYVSVESFCWGPNGDGSVNVGFGDLLRGDDSSVQHASRYFMVAGTPTVQLREARNRLRFPDERPQPDTDGYPIKLVQPLDDRDAVRCTRPVTWQRAIRGDRPGIGASRALFSVSVGDKLHKDAEVVLAHPKSFRPWLEAA